MTFPIGKPLRDAELQQCRLTLALPLLETYPVFGKGSRPVMRHRITAILRNYLNSAKRALALFGSSSSASLFSL